MTSLLMLTLDRFETTKRVLEKNLENAGITDYELLVADNGSKDRRIVDYIASLNPAYHRVNSKNEGCAHAFNQLLLRANGDHVCLMGNDIELPNTWLCHFNNWAFKCSNKMIPYGLIGMKCTTVLPPLSTRNGLEAHWLDEVIDKVFGVTFFSRNILNDVGGFYEGFGPYGGEDSDFNNRVNRSGLQSFYIPSLVSTHVCDDVGEDSEYRRMKDESLTKNMTILGERMEGYSKNGFYEPLPAPRFPQ